MLSLKQITYALAVAEQLHFKKAADACAISQSALSTGLNELEKQLGFQIFERDNKKVLITPLGQLFLERARHIKQEINALLQLADTYKMPLSSPMTLGAIPTIGPYLFPKVLPALRSGYPDFQLRLVENQTRILLNQVRSGELDSAIIALPYGHDGLLSFEFWQEDFYWLSHQEDCPDIINQISHDQLKNKKLMLLEEGHCLKDHALAACKLRPGEHEETFSATSLHMLIHMVAGKIGSTLVPEIALDQLLNKDSGLRAVALAEAGPHRQLAFVVRPNYPGLSSIELLAQLFKQQLSERKSTLQALNEFAP
ncbi:MAG TPA: LysR substrate-binding domain-containing protein [Pseudomonadales bacterium]|nr:LysR substrate-binding domain-containing protein [Pseudomonadales bacterium]